MSYDTVALVAQEPGLETVARTLERTVPGLWVQPHPGTGLLELHEDDGSLVATVEPGLALASRREIGRLLGPEQQDAAPDPCWWVETRARPDDTGRKVADGIARALTDRLGGTVWTSGPADIDFRVDPPAPRRRPCHRPRRPGDPGPARRSLVLLARRRSPGRWP